MSQSRTRFFRQSIWLSFATVLGGLFMTAVHSVAGEMGRSQYAVFGAMLRLFILLGIPSAGLQIAFARQSAAALDSDRQRQLAATTRRVLGAIFLLWLGMVGAVFWGYDAIRLQLKLGSGQVIWPTLGLALLWLVVPVFRGLLQGEEDFGTLGWVGILDGFLRFTGMAVAVLVFGTGATAAITIAFLAMAVSTMLAARATRSIWMGPGAPFSWRPWMAQVLPFTLGAGAMLLLANFDLIYLQAIIPAERSDEFQLSARYQPAFLIGFALTQVTVPLAMVMFPKIARSSVTGTKVDALALALIGTAVVGSFSVGLLTLFPAFPLQILYFRSPENWAAAAIVPWSAWAMLAFALANVLVSNLLAQERFQIVPWAVGVAAVYVVTLLMLRTHLLGLEPFTAFRRVAQLIGGFNLLLLGIAAFQTWGRPAPKRTEAFPV